MLSPRTREDGPEFAAHRTPSRAPRWLATKAAIEALTNAPVAQTSVSEHAPLKARRWTRLNPGVPRPNFHRCIVPNLVGDRRTT
jgi:hypothetical protein